MNCVLRIQNSELIITHSDRAQFNLNALVSSLGTIVPSAYGLGHYDPSSLHSGI